jgi:methylthioribose-1-phosphate isomerase
MASISSLQSLKYTRGSLEVLDQLLLPHSIQYINVNDSKGAWAVIRSMQVRGAPLIAITAALGLAVEAFKLFLSEAGNVNDKIGVLNDLLVDTLHMNMQS